MEHFKRSTARDFRINGATLEAALREESSDEDDDEDHDDEHDEVKIHLNQMFNHNDSLLQCKSSLN